MTVNVADPTGCTPVVLLRTWNETMESRSPKNDPDAGLQLLTVNPATLAGMVHDTFAPAICAPLLGRLAGTAMLFGVISVP